MSNVIPNVEEIILQSTLEYGAKHGVARVSTIEVAANADVSEYTIFKHFKTKKGLLYEAAKYCVDKITQWNLEASKEAESIENYWDISMARLREKPTTVLFFYNYVSYFGFDEFRNSKKSHLECGRNLLGPNHSEEDCLKFWDYITTLIYLYFAKIDRGALSFEGDDMKSFKKLIFDGINSIK